MPEATQRQTFEFTSAMTADVVEKGPIRKKIPPPPFGTYSGILKKATEVVMMGTEKQGLASWEEALLEKEKKAIFAH